jgi:hypothetical protein
MGYIVVCKAASLSKSLFFCFSVTQRLLSITRHAQSQTRHDTTAFTRRGPEAGRTLYFLAHRPKLPHELWLPCVYALPMACALALACMHPEL